MSDANQDKPSFLEILGLLPLAQRARETAFALRGDEHTPPTLWGPSSLKIMRPDWAIKLWRGQKVSGRSVPIYNLFNRTQTPPEQGWSVRKTQVRDFRGGDLTYDSHNGTDFATPPATVVVAPAAGRVAVVVSEFHRGGLKVMVDHGGGLATMAGHLSRALVTEGQRVARGEPIALSGASGLNFVATLLADSPHVHFNVWHQGEAVDPFAMDGEESLWRVRNAPEPNRAAADKDVEPTDFDDDVIDAWIAGCRDPEMAARLRAIDDPWLRGNHTVFYAHYYPTRFAQRPNPFKSRHERAPRLDLPFLPDDYDGIAL